MSRALSLVAFILILASPVIAGSQDCETRARTCVAIAVSSMEAVGVLASTDTYMTYRFIDVTSEAYAKKAYDAKQVEVLMSEASTKIKLVKKQIANLRTLVADDDKWLFDEYNAIYDLLARATTALVSWAKLGVLTDYEAFQKAHKGALQRQMKLYARASAALNGAQLTP